MQDITTDLAWAQGNMAFFHFLQDRPQERFSRFEAYCYMLDKACARYRPANIPEKWLPAIGAGQFFITKSELSTDWHWHRATVRWFLQKLTKFGHITVEEHLKGCLCTMHHLIVPASPGVAVAYNFDAMAKYVMYSYARGTQDLQQTIDVCGQIERSAKAMLVGNQQSSYTKKQLEDVRKTLLRYAIESTIAHHPGKLSVDEEIRYNTSLMEKRLFEFFTDSLSGNWATLLGLMSNQTELAFTTLVQSLHAGRTERERLWESLAAVGKTLPVSPDDTADSDKESPADGSMSPSAPESLDSVTSPDDSDASPLDKDNRPDDVASEDAGEVTGTSPVTSKGIAILS